MRICIDFGHTATGRGAGGYFDEYTETHELGRRVEAELKKRGHEVLNSTAPDSMPYPQETDYRPQYEHENAPFDLFLSIHFNSVQGGGGHGTECWHWHEDSKGEQAAALMSANVSKCLSTTNRGAKACTGQYAVIRDTWATAILLETCFCNNAEDFQKYAAVSYADIVGAICDSVEGKEWSKAEQEQPKPEEQADKVAEMVAQEVKKCVDALGGELAAQVVEEIIKRLANG